MSLLKQKHQFVFIFFEDYNIPVAKAILFLTIFGLNVAVNGLFFRDDNMHRIYMGNYTFLYELPGLIYSTLITIIFSTLMKKFALTQALILNFKKIEFTDKKKMLKEKNNLMNIVKIRFYIFMFCVFIFLVAFWYYVGCFCAVYKNTQLHLIKDTAISFGTSLLYPLGFNLLPGIFRMMALKNERERRIRLYNFSKILALF